MAVEVAVQKLVWLTLGGGTNMFNRVNRLAGREMSVEPFRD